MQELVTALLFFIVKQKKAIFLENKGLGLGIMRNDTYQNFIETSSMPYEREDILVLYTDGISETKNEQTMNSDSIE